MGTDSTFRQSSKYRRRLTRLTVLYNYRDVLPNRLSLYNTYIRIVTMYSITRNRFLHCFFFTYLYPSQNYPQTEERHLDFCCRGTSRMRCARSRHSCERVPLPMNAAAFRNTREPITFQNRSFHWVTFYHVILTPCYPIFSLTF